MADVGTFRTTIAIENPLERGKRHELPDTLVDTGAELTWAPTAVLESLGIARQKRLGFRTADGRACFATSAMRSCMPAAPRRMTRSSSPSRGT